MRNPDDDSHSVTIPTPDSRLPAPDMIFLALHETMRRFDLPVSLFDDLLSAFRQDITTTRYESWEAVMDYCRRSANPVGRLVLRLSGYQDAALDAASDAVCTALQLTNFWQDLAIDWSRGRLYVPAETWRRHGADPATLDAGRMTPAWAAALGDCGARTRALFAAGRPVCDGVAGRLRYELRATWLGGTRILDRLERARYDVFTARPSLGKSDALVIAWGALPWRRARPHAPSHRVARDTSFSYSFVVLPADQRQAIGVVWDFCRAVDDAVDEAPDPVTARDRDCRRGARTWTACSAPAIPCKPQATSLKPIVARFGLSRQPFDDLVDGVEMDLRRSAVPDLRRAGRLLPPRGVGRGPDVHRDLRVPRCAVARLRLQPRPRAAIDQHHPGRGGGPGATAACTCRKRISSGSASRKTPCAPAR